MTPPFTRIICLANSWKHGERCIAGLDIFTGRWVRPVTDLDDGRVPKAVRLVDGVEPALLDILDIPLADDGPDYGFESENRRILPGTWRRAGLASPKDIARHCAPGGLILHNTARTVRKSHLESLPAAARSSLALVRTTSFAVAVGAENKLGGHKWDGTLETRDGQRLTATITDPVFVARLEAGYRPSDQCFVIVSLSMPYPGEVGGEPDVCWKLLAGVIDINPVTRRHAPGWDEDDDAPWPKPTVFAALGTWPIALSADGATLTTGIEPKEENVSTMSHPLRGVHVWDTTARRRMRTRTYADISTGPAVLRGDGAEVVRQSNGNLELLTTGDPPRVEVLGPMPRLVTALLAPRGKDLLVVAASEMTSVGLRDPEITLWDLTRQGSRERLEMPAVNKNQAIGVTSLAAAANGVLFAGVVGCREQDVVCLWDMAGKLLQSVSATKHLGGLGTVSALAFHPTEPLLAVGSWDGSATLWDMTNWSLVHVFHGPTRSIVDAVAFSSRGTWFAYGTGSHPGYGNVYERDGVVLCNWRERREVAVLGHHDIVSGLVFSDDESTLGSFSIDGVVKAWRVRAYESRT